MYSAELTICTVHVYIHTCTFSKCSLWCVEVYDGIMVRQTALVVDWYPGQCPGNYVKVPTYSPGVGGRKNIWDSVL